MPSTVSRERVWCRDEDHHHCISPVDVRRGLGAHCPRNKERVHRRSPPRSILLLAGSEARPQIVVPNIQRSASFSPPPMPLSPPTTPGPSVSSRASAVSSKRPFTPDDDEDEDMLKQSRKKQPAAHNCWKGWVEASPPPLETIINFNSVVVLAQRKTRSGKSFDAIGAGQDGWV